MVGIGARHRLAAQKVAAVRIRQGQGLAPRPVAGPEPALEIDAPHVVGRSARGKRRRARRHAPAQPALHRQTLAIEQGPDRARRRPANARIATLQPGPHLHRTPTRMRPPNRQARARNLLRQRPHTPVRRPRAVRKPRNTVQPIARKPLVTDPTAHTEPTTGRGKRFLTRLNRHHKTHPFIHSTGLLPNHRQAPPRRSSDLLPMSPVQTVTYVSGLHLAPPQPPGGGGWGRYRPDR